MQPENTCECDPDSVCCCVLQMIMSGSVEEFKVNFLNVIAFLIVIDWPRMGCSRVVV